jgi:hypothetical protein
LWRTVLSDKPTVEEILRKVESDLNTLRWGHQRGELFIEAGKLFEEKGNLQKAKEMSWENQLFCLMYLDPTRQKTSLRRFAPLVEYTSGTVFPDVESFSEEQLDYYRKRADETRNPIHKARYSDIIWELRKDHIFARKAIDAHLQCVPLFYDNDWQLEMVDSLGRAAQLALYLNDKNEVNKVKKELFRWIRILADNSKYRFCLEIIDAILEMKKFVDNEELETTVKIADSGTRYYEKMKDGYHLQRSFLERLVKLMLVLKRPEKGLEYRKQIAESFVKEADWKLENYPSGNLVAAFFYEEAAKSYTDLGLPEKADELKRKIKIHTRKATETEFKEIKTTVTFPRKPIRDYIRKLTSLTLGEVLTEIVNETSFLPNLRRIKLEVEETKKKSPLSFVIPRVSIRDDNPVWKSQTEEELLEEHIVQRVAMDYKIKSGMFGDIMKELESEKNLDHVSLLVFLSSSGVYEKDSLNMIGTGLERYFSEDFPSALHLLIPQLERTLRNMLEKLGVATTILRGRVVEEKTLGRILKEPKLEEFLGEDVSCYLRTFLIDKRGDNLRNDIAHGLITREKCTRNMANTLLFIFLLLTRFGPRRK